MCLSTAVWHTLRRHALSAALGPVSHIKQWISFFVKFALNVPRRLPEQNWQRGFSVTWISALIWSCKKDQQSHICCVCKCRHESDWYSVETMCRGGFNSGTEDVVAEKVKRILLELLFQIIIISFASVHLIVSSILHHLNFPLILFKVVVKESKDVKLNNPVESWTLIILMWSQSHTRTHKSASASFFF